MFPVINWCYLLFLILTVTAFRIDREKFRFQIPLLVTVHQDFVAISVQVDETRVKDMRGSSAELILTRIHRCTRK